MTILFLALGGAIGTVLRFLSVEAVGRVTHGHWGTFAVNVIGSFLIGLGFALLVERAGVSRLSIVLMTGVLGGFTTFSAFALEAIALWERGRMAEAFAYAGGSVMVALAAAMLGLAIGRGLA